MTTGGFTENAVSLREHFAVDEQIARADLHRWNDDNGTASLLRAGIAGTARTARASAGAAAAIAVVFRATETKKKFLKKLKMCGMRTRLKIINCVNCFDMRRIDVGV